MIKTYMWHTRLNAVKNVIATNINRTQLICLDTGEIKLVDRLTERYPIRKRVTPI